MADSKYITKQIQINDAFIDINTNAFEQARRFVMDQDSKIHREIDLIKHFLIKRN